MSTKTVGEWGKSLLPGNFKQVIRRTQEIQQFLTEHLPEPINRQVSVINISADEIVIAASNPQVANYLRLYVTEVQQQIHETFQLSQKLKIRSLPESLLKVDNPPGSRKPAKVSDENVAALKRSVGWIEDENLKQSLQSLANTLKKTEKSSP
jgi:hypothetical protein